MNNLDPIRSELDTLTKIIVDTVPVEQVYLLALTPMELLTKILTLIYMSY